MRWLGIQIEQQRRVDSQETPQVLNSAALDSGSDRQPVSGKQPGDFAWQDRREEASASNGCRQASSIRWLQHLQGYRDRKGLAKKSRRPTSWVHSTGESSHARDRNHIAKQLLLCASGLSHGHVFSLNPPIRGCAFFTLSNTTCSLRLDFFQLKSQLWAMACKPHPTFYVPYPQSKKK